jgi:1,4-dihydroxy-2-naphthoate octaprenyltransferase
MSANLLAHEMRSHTLLDRAFRWVRFFEMRLPDGVVPLVPGMVMAWHPNAGVEFWRPALLILTFFFLVLLFIHGADAIIGYLRGVDRIVYAQGGYVKEPKLLVTGEVRLPEAVVAVSLVALGMVGSAAYLIATLNQTALLMALAVAAFAGQYSVGLRLSYRGLGEAVIASTGMLTPVAYTALTGQVALGPFLVGAVQGLFFAGVNLNSNHADYPYDLAAGRGTLAVRLGLAGHRRVGVALFFPVWGCYIAALAIGALPPYAVVGLLLTLRHVRQLRLLYAGKPIEARTLGFKTLRMVFAVVTLSLVLEHVLTHLKG